MSEQESLASGELQTSPISTVLGEHVYSYVGGPKPGPKRMAADEAIEKRIGAAGKLPKDASAAESAKAAGAYADSAQRIADRLIAYLNAGGATFKWPTRNGWPERPPAAEFVSTLWTVRLPVVGGRTAS